MKYLVFFFITLIILSIGFGIHYIFDKNLKLSEGYILGVLVSILLWIIFHNTSKKLEFVEKNSKILNYLALSISIIGGIIWLMGNGLYGEDKMNIQF